MFTRKPRLFLAEDDPVNQTIISNQLQHLPIHVTLAHHGKEILDACANGLPDLIILDIEMPIMDGIETIRELRNKYGTELPVIALTGHENFPFAAYGFQDSLTKPVHTQTLLSIIKTYFNIDHMVEEQYHYQKLLDVCNGDAKFALRMLNLFIQQTETDLQDLMELGLSAEKEKVRMILHRMKSTLGYMGLGEIRQEAMRLELLAKVEMPSANDIGQFVSSLRSKMPMFQKVKALL